MIMSQQPQHAGVSARWLMIIAALLAASALDVPVAHGGTIAMRYASPTGSPAGSCDASTPCDLVTAINSAAAGTDVVIEPGSYYSEAAPLTTELTNSNPITIHAEDPAQVPVIYTAASTGLLVNDASISDVVLVASGATTGIQLNAGSADHIAVFASAGALGACTLYGATVTDSVCSQTQGNAPAIGISASGGVEYANMLRNVTAVSTGAGSYAFAAAANDSDVSSKVSNTILDGAGGDIRLGVTGAGSMTMNVKYSAYRPTATTLAGGELVDGVGNIAGAPQFVSAATGNFEELPSSPTVDAGGKAPVSDVDLANLPRTIGRAPDIGAYELAVPPAIHHLSVLKVKRHSATITVAVDGQGLAATETVVASSGQHQVATPDAPVPTARAAKVTLHHLLRHRRYSVRVHAQSVGGTTSSASRSFVTK